MLTSLISTFWDLNFVIIQYLAEVARVKILLCWAVLTQSLKNIAVIMLYHFFKRVAAWFMAVQWVTIFYNLVITVKFWSILMTEWLWISDTIYCAEPS